MPVSGTFLLSSGNSILTLGGVLSVFRQLSVGQRSICLSIIIQQFENGLLLCLLEYE